LEEVACLAACGNAPAVVVNNFSYAENITPEAMDRLLADLRTQPGQIMAKGPLPRLPDPHLHLEKQSTPQATGSLGEPAVTTRPEAGSTERK
ncbi:MAG: NAD(P)H-dependent oxidoreductase subunit E, partial [Myxococcales bacterium]